MPDPDAPSRNEPTGARYPLPVPVPRIPEATRNGAGWVARMLRALFAYSVENPPAAVTPDATEAERITDYIAGMTDRYAVRAFSELSVPHGF